MTERLKQYKQLPQLLFENRTSYYYFIKNIKPCIFKKRNIFVWLLLELRGLYSQRKEVLTTKKFRDPSWPPGGGWRFLIFGFGYSKVVDMCAEKFPLMSLGAEQRIQCAKAWQDPHQRERKLCLIVIRLVLKVRHIECVGEFILAEVNFFVTCLRMFDE